MQPMRMIGRSPSEPAILSVFKLNYQMERAGNNIGNTAPKDLSWNWISEDDWEDVKKTIEENFALLYGEKSECNGESCPDCKDNPLKCPKHQIGTL